MMKVLFTVKASKTHIDCVTKGETYNVVTESKNWYEIYPDSHGNRSNVHKSYFETLTTHNMLQELIKKLNNEVNSQQANGYIECLNNLEDTLPTKPTL